MKGSKKGAVGQWEETFAKKNAVASMKLCSMSCFAGSWTATSLRMPSTYGVCRSTDTCSVHRPQASLLLCSCSQVCSPSSYLSKYGSNHLYIAEAAIFEEDAGNHFIKNGTLEQTAACHATKTREDSSDAYYVRIMAELWDLKSMCTWHVLFRRSVNVFSISSCTPLPSTCIVCKTRANQLNGPRTL